MKTSSQSLRYAWYIVAVFSCLGVISMLDRFSLNLLVEPIKEDLKISDSQVGLLMGPAFSIVYAISAFPIAWCLDRFSRKWITVGAVTLWSFSTSLSAFAQNFEVLFFLRMGIGIGEAVLNPVVVSLVADLFFRQQRSTPISVFMTSQALGGSIVFIIVAALIRTLEGTVLPFSDYFGDVGTWRLVLFCVGLPGMLIAAVIAITIREPERGSSASEAKLALRPEYGRPFVSNFAASRFYAPYLLGINLVGMVTVISVSWFSAYLIRRHNMSMSEVGFLFGGSTLLATFGMIGWPLLTQRLVSHGRNDAALTVLLFLVPGALLSFGAAMMASNLIASLFFIMIFHTFANGALVSPSIIIGSLAGANKRARLVATHLLVQAAIAYSLGPVLVPLLSDTMFDGEIGASMLVVSSCGLIISFLCILFSRHPYRQALDNLDDLSNRFTAR